MKRPKSLISGVALIAVASISLLVISPASAPAQDDRVSNLEATVAALEERVTALEESAVVAPFVEVTGESVAISGTENGALDPIDLAPGMYYFQLNCDGDSSLLNGEYADGDFFGLFAIDGAREFEAVDGRFVLTVSCYDGGPWTLTIQSPE